MGEYSLRAGIVGAGAFDGTGVDWFPFGFAQGRLFSWGAGFLLLDVLRRLAMSLWPGGDLEPGKPPLHLERSHNRKLLGKAYHFLKWGEVIYAHHKVIAPKTDFSNAKMLPYLLHILQSSGFPPRIFWNRSLKTTPNAPF